MNAPLDLSSIVPPHHEESEQAVLGGILKDNTAIDRANVTEADFYAYDHRLIWKAITGLLDACKPADIITVAEALGSDLDRVGGLQYLVAISQDAHAANVRSYSNTVRDRAIRRRIIETGNNIAQLGYQTGAAEGIAKAQAMAMELDTTEAVQESMSLRDALKQMIERVDRMHSGTEVATSTGFADLDKKIIGLGAGDMVVVAGRPAMGKTAFALQIATNVAETDPVLVFSLEMGAEQLAMRQAATAGKIDLMALRSGNLSEDDWGRLTYALGKLRERPMFIDDRGGLSMSQIRARARQTKRKHGLGLIVVDYIQLIHGDGNNRVDVVSEISRGMKAMARELGVPVIALSQLSRKVEERTDKRPQMSDLRESGAIEQDADLILMLYRDDYYNPDSQWKGVAECIVAKQRSGPTGMVPLTFIAEHAQFADFAGRYEPDSRESKPAKRGFN